MRPGSIEYDPVLADEILERLADGDSLASICGDEGMPATRSAPMNCSKSPMTRQPIGSTPRTAAGSSTARM
jgi:hypothetical protein